MSSTKSSDDRPKMKPNVIVGVGGSGQTVATELARKLAGKPPFPANRTLRQGEIPKR